MVEAGSNNCVPNWATICRSRPTATALCRSRMAQSLPRYIGMNNSLDSDNQALAAGFPGLGLEFTFAGSAVNAQFMVKD